MMDFDGLHHKRDRKYSIGDRDSAVGLKWSCLSKIRASGPDFIIEIGDQGAQENWDCLSDCTSFYLWVHSKHFPILLAIFKINIRDEKNTHKLQNNIFLWRYILEGEWRGGFLQANIMFIVL